MFYLVIIPSSFRKSSLEELGSSADFKVVEDSVTSLIVNSKERNLAEKLLSSNPVFVYNIFGLSKRFAIEKSKYLDSIYGGMAKSIPSKGSLKIECYDVNSKEGYSAKDIEVSLGQRLERRGRSIDLKNPKWLVYLVLINMRCYLGYADYAALKKKFVNPERHYHRFSKDSLSRAELKLMQAFDEFGIHAQGTAIDLGASPGGWSKFLADSGLKVIAIDKARLDADSMLHSGIKVKVVRSAKNLARYLENNDIVHVRSNARDVKLTGISASLIVDDMNTEAGESAKLLLSFSKNLAKNGYAILTVKCLNRKAERHIRNAADVLNKGFRIRGIRVLPSNRQELTICASKR